MYGFSWFSFLFSPINNALNRLAHVVGSEEDSANSHCPKYIMNYSTTEAVKALDGAANVVVSLKAALASALEAVAPLVADNASLKDAQDQLVAADKEVDAAIARLAAVTAAAPEPEPAPVEEEVVAEEEVPPTEEVVAE